MRTWKRGVEQARFYWGRGRKERTAIGFQFHTSTDGRAINELILGNEIVQTRPYRMGIYTLLTWHIGMGNDLLITRPIGWSILE